MKSWCAELSPIFVCEIRWLPEPRAAGPATCPRGEQMSIYDASVRYQKEGTPLFVIAGKEYGTGSSRDWAAKGTLLLGVKAVIAESFERIHRSNLVGMGVLPAAIRRRAKPRIAVSHRSGIVLDRRHSSRSRFGRQDSREGNRRAQWIEQNVRSHRAHRYAAGSRILPQRRNSSLRAAPVGGAPGGGLMGKPAAIVLYGVAMVAVIVGVDFVFFRNRFWERLTVNIGIVLVFGAFYYRFLRRP